MLYDWPVGWKEILNALVVILLDLKTKGVGGGGVGGQSKDLGTDL